MLALARLFERLEQCVGRAIAHPVGGIEDNDPPPRAPRAELGLGQNDPHLGDRDLGAHLAPRGGRPERDLALVGAARCDDANARMGALVLDRKSGLERTGDGAAALAFPARVVLAGLRAVKGLREGQRDEPLADPDGTFEEHGGVEPVRSDRGAQPRDRAVMTKDGVPGHRRTTASARAVQTGENDFPHRARHGLRRPGSVHDRHPPAVCGGDGPETAAHALVEPRRLVVDA